MADAEVSVVINAVDNASGTLRNVASEVNSVSGVSKNMGVSMTAASSSAAELEKRLQRQKTVTSDCSKKLAEAATRFDTQKKTVREAAHAYKSNTAEIKKNIASLTGSKNILSGQIALRDKELEGLENVRKSLNRGTDAYRENAANIRWVSAEKNSLLDRYREASRAISDNERALQNEENAYRKAQSNVKSAAADVRAYTDAVNKSRTAEREYTEAINNAGGQARDWEEAGKSAQEFGKGLDKIAKPLQTAAVGIAAGGVMAAKSAMDYETAFTGVKKTVDGTPEQLAEISAQMKQMSEEIPMSAAELANLAAVAGQLGVGAEDISKFTKSMAAMGVATNLSGEEGAATLARFINVSGESLDNIDRVSSVIVALGNNTATTEADIASMALRMGKFGNTVGMNSAQILGYSAALSSAGIEAQLGGSAIGRVWLDIESAVGHGGKELEAYAKVAGTSAEDFAKQWSDEPSGAFNGLIKGLASAENLTLAMEELGINNTQDQQAVQALANNYGLLEKCMSLSADAYKENTALDKEASAAYDTTASKLQMTKNSVVNAAAAWGDQLLPEVSKGAGALQSAAQWFGSLDDNTKQAYITAGKFAVGTGAVTKGLSAMTKGAGGIIEGAGQIKKFLAAAKAAPGILGTLGSAAAPVAAGVAAIAAAAVIGKAAYDTWYNSQFRWSEGLSEGNDRIRDSLEDYKKISDIRREVKDLNLVINNPESSREQVENAKARLEEIRALLREEYNLVINSDNSNLEETVEKVEQMSKNDLQTKINEQMVKLSRLASKDATYKQDLAKPTEEYNKYFAQQEKFSKAQAEITNLQTQVAEGRISEAEAYSKAKKIYEDANGKSYRPTDQIFDNINGVLTSIASGYAIAAANAEKFKAEIDNLNGSHAELHAVSEEIANWKTEIIKTFADEGDSEGIQAALQSMKLLIELGGLDMEGYAQAAAVAMAGTEDLAAAWQQAASGNGAALDKVINGYVTAMTAFGATATQTALGATALKNGFASVGEAINKMGAKKFTEQLNEIGHSLKMIPEDKIVTVSFNVETGGHDILDQAGKKLGEITADGTVIWTSDTTEPDGYEPPPKKGTAAYGVDDSEVQAYQPPPKTGTVKYGVVIEDSTKGNFGFAAMGGGSGWSKIIPGKAKGTRNFGGGLAMVNDDGKKDPRELIIDRGRAFIPEGENVVLPLSRGAKVYTSDQTKELMRRMGIPGFAAGKDNSDAFTAASEDWSHYTKTHAVTTTQELEKWVELSGKFKDNQKDVRDIQEQIFTLTRKQTDELNGQSIAYIEERAALNDWEEYEDSAEAAFARIKERNLEEVRAQRMTWDEYVKNVSDAGETLYESRAEQSREWLEHERKYNNMSSEDYIAGLQRMAKDTLSFYEQGIIDKRKYAEEAKKIDEEYLDAYKEMLDKQKKLAERENKISENYINEHTYFNDWSGVGDDPFSAYERVRGRVLGGLQEQIESGLYNDEEIRELEDDASDYLEGLGSDMYAAQKEQSGKLLDEQREYFGMERDEYIAGLEKQKADAEEFYRNQLISRIEYNESMTELNHAIWDEEAAAYDDMLSKQQEYISKTRDMFSEQEEALRTSWDVEDRGDDLDEVNRLLGIYKDSVTDAGQSKYKDLLKRKEELERDEEIYQLQKKNAAAIEALENEYEEMEANKSVILAGMHRADINIDGRTADISASVDAIGTMAETVRKNFDTASERTQGLLGEMLNALNILTRKNDGGNHYTDNRNIHIAGASQSAIAQLIKGVTVTANGAVIV